MFFLGVVSFIFLDKKKTPDIYHIIQVRNIFSAQKNTCINFQIRLFSSAHSEKQSLYPVNRKIFL